MKNLKVKSFSESAKDEEINDFLKNKEVFSISSLSGYANEIANQPGYIYIFYKDEEET